MVNLKSPKLVISIPRLAAYFVVGCFIMYALEVGPRPTNNQPIKSAAPTSNHENVIVTPPPAVPLQPAPTTTTNATTNLPKANTITTAAPHSTQPEPVVTPAPSASVSGLAPVNPTSTPSTSSSSSSPTPAQPTAPVTNSYTSTNWAGYMATTGSYSAISGSWTVPSATGVTSKSSSDATWIGIGGVTASDLIQVGTDNTVSASGHETSGAFYEMLPQSSRPIPKLPVSPGDKMSASLSEVTTGTGQWQISITDNTTGKSYTSTVKYLSSHSSAEWIEEDPSTTSNQLIPLDNFAAISFTGGSTTSTGSNLTLSNSNAEPVTMVSATTKQSVVIPSALNSDGQSFTVTRN